jgi:hypothetical protein
MKKYHVFFTCDWFAFFVLNRNPLFYLLTLFLYLFIFLPVPSCAWPTARQQIPLCKSGVYLRDANGSTASSGENNTIRLSTSIQNIPQYIEGPPNAEGNRIISYFSVGVVHSSNPLLLKIDNMCRLQFSYWLAICIYYLNYSILLKKRIRNKKNKFVFVVI